MSDARNEFVVVHNGIITNHKALRDFLVCFREHLVFFKDVFRKDVFRSDGPTAAAHAYSGGNSPFVMLQVKKGEVFVSDTDTEVIPKLCKWVYHSLEKRVPFSEVRRCYR